MDLVWAELKGSAMLRQLASFSRLILFDKPGTGLSDPVVGAPSLEQRVGDISAVMDAVGSERAALIGYSEGAAPSLVFAATYPERAAALILLGTTAKWYPAPDFFGDLASFQRFWRVIDEVAYNRWAKASSCSSLRRVGCRARCITGQLGSLSARVPARAWCARCTTRCGGTTYEQSCRQSACRRSCFTAAKSSYQSSWAAIWPSGCPTLATWSFWERITCSSQATGSPSRERLSSS